MPKKASIQITADLNLLIKELREAKEELRKLNKGATESATGIRKVENAAKDAGKQGGFLKSTFAQLTASFTVATLAADGIRRSLRAIKDAFIGAVKGAIDFEAQLVQVRKVTGATREEMGILKDFLEDLSVQTGITKEELADIAAGGGRLGIFDREGLTGLQEFTRVISLSRIAMEDYAGSSEEATDKTARLLNLFNLKTKDAEVLLSVMNELSNTAAATSSNIADNVQNFASLSQSFGASKESLLALATTMEEVGSEPQAFSTALQNALIKMQGDVDTFAKFLGPTVGEEFKKVFAEEPIEAFAIFLRELSKQGRDVGKVLEGLGIGDARLIRELSKLATDRGLELFAKNLGNAKRAAEEAEDAVAGLTDQGSSLQQEFDRASDTTKRRLASLGEQVGNVGNAFGERLLPELNETIELLTNGLERAIPFVVRLGDAFGSVLGQVNNLVGGISELVGLLGGNVNAGKKLAIRATEFITGLDLSDPLRQAQKALAGAQSRRVPQVLTGTIGGGATPSSAGSTFEGVIPTGGGGGKKEEKADEGKIVKLLEDQIDARKKIREEEIKSLKLKQELGVLTEDEARRLRILNNRLDFQDDLISDATKEWKDQVRALDDVEKKIGDINEKIAQEQRDLQDTIADIEKDANQSKIDAAADLIRELNDLRKKGTDTTAEDENRIREIDAQLDPLRQTEQGRGILQAADEDVALTDPFERIDKEKEAKIAAAQEESDARIASLQAELAEAEKNKTEITRLENEKKQIVLDALRERTEQTTINYQLLEERTKTHVDQQIEQFNRLKTALSDVTAGQVAALGGPAPAADVNRALGGIVRGRGGPTSDSILARLSDGEFVINAAATQRFRPMLEKINAMTLPGFARGGAVTTNNSRSANITINNHGEAARVFADPRRARWVERTYLG